MAGVLIFTEGSSKVGFGHLGRCGALAQAVEHLGGKPYFVVSADRSGEEFLKKVGFPYSVVKELNEVNLEHFGGEIAVIDSYTVNLEFYLKAVKRFKKVLFVDDFLRLDYPKEGTLLNYVPAFKVPPEYKNRLVGAEFHLLRKPFWEVPEREVRKEVSKVLVTFGGDDLRNLTPKVLRLLLGNFKRLEVAVVVGGGFKNTDKIEELKRSYPDRVKLFKKVSAEGMKSLMLEADLAVSAGGQTLFELAVCGTPTLAVGVAENQRANLKGFTEEGFLEGFLWWNDKDFENRLLEAFEKLFPRERRKKLSERGRSLIDGKGALRVAEYLLKV